MKYDLFSLLLACIVGMVLMYGIVGLPSGYTVSGSDIRRATETCEQLGHQVENVTSRSGVVRVQCEGGPMVTLRKEK